MNLFQGFPLRIAGKIQVSIIHHFIFTKALVVVSFFRGKMVKINLHNVQRKFIKL